MRLSPLSPRVGLHNALFRAREGIDRSLERLATGKRINRAKDDPSGLVAAEALRSDRATLTAKLKSIERQSAFLGAKDGALSVLGDLLTELRGLVVGAANRDALSPTEQRALQDEADGLLGAIDFAVATSEFNDQDLLAGFSTTRLGTTSREGEQTGGRLADLRAGGAASLLTGDLELGQGLVDAALARVNGERGRIGGRLIGLDAERNALASQFENVSGALSLIEDTDVAREVGELVRNQILEEASIRAVLIGRQNAETVLALLENAKASPPGSTRPASAAPGSARGPAGSAGPAGARRGP